MIERFTVYDIFATLVPGVVFAVLLMVTFENVLERDVVNWSGGFGDATVLVIIGYAVGVLLQAIGKAVIEPIWLWIRGGLPSATLLYPNSKVLTAEMKQRISSAISTNIQEINLPSRKPILPRRLREVEEVTYRVYKTIADKDEIAPRFLAETHGMRAYAISFLLLSLITIIGSKLIGEFTWSIHGLFSILFAILALLAFRRMEDK